MERSSTARGQGHDENAVRRPTWVAITPGSAKRTATTAILLVAGLLLGIWAFGALSSFLFLLVLAWLLSIAMEPPVVWLMRHGVRPRGLATGLVMLVLLVITGAILVLFGQVFFLQATQLGQTLPGTTASALAWVNEHLHTDIDLTKIQTTLDLTPSRLGELAGRYGGGILGVFGSVLTFLFDLLTILVFAYYLSADSPRLRQTIGSFLPPHYQEVMQTVWQIAVEKTGGYVISKVVLATLSAIFHAAFFFWIDVPFWLPLGLLAGIVGQFIPTIGTYIGILLPALFTVVLEPRNVLWIVLFATVYQQVENYVFTPRISRRTMDVHPAVALGAVFVGAALFGPIGAIIGIPVVAAVITIVDTFRRRHELLPQLQALREEELPPEAEEDDAPADGPAPPDRIPLDPTLG